MPVFTSEAVSIHFDDEGDGFPVLLIAPGGMRSANDLWSNAPWNPRDALAGRYRLLGMDQRNAGRSSAPVSAADGWPTYTADQLALLDHLAVERCHVIGMCIGGPYVVGLLTAAPDRFASAVLLQPVGIEGNRDVFRDLFDQWSGPLRAAHPEADDAAWASFRANMWDGEFVLTATPDQVAGLATPMLVAMGDDVYHPRSTSRRIAELAPGATLVESWKEGDDLVALDAAITTFLRSHTP